MTSFSQNGEDLILAEHFGAKADGRLLDVGAWSGRVLSNSFLFFERGWTGVCVEPSPTAFLGLMEAHKDRPGVELVNAAVAGEAGLMDFYDCGGDAVSTLSAEHAKKWSSQATFRRFAVSTITPGQLLDRYGRDFDALSLDVEGNSAALLRHFPIALMPRLTAVVVEHDSRERELAEWMAGFGFTLRTVNNENAVFVR